jgi:hypothetical protein
MYIDRSAVCSRVGFFGLSAMVSPNSRLNLGHNLHEILMAYQLASF